MSPSIVPRGIYQNTSGLCEIKNYYVTKSIWKSATSAQKDGRIAIDGPLYTGDGPALWDYPQEYLVVIRDE